jgi:hypothetical protein
MQHIRAIASNIHYVTDGQNAELPAELHFLYSADLTEPEVAEQVEDDITETTGFLHNGFDLEIRHFVAEGSLPGSCEITRDGSLYRLWQAGAEGALVQVGEGYYTYQAAAEAAREMGVQPRSVDDALLEQLAAARAHALQSEAEFRRQEKGVSVSEEEKLAWLLKGRRELQAPALDAWNQFHHQAEALADTLLASGYGQEPPHLDDRSVDAFALAMKAKLQWEREAKGRHGWHDPAVCSTEYLAMLLIEHLGKGNPGNFEDVANFCMMLHQRGDHPAVLAEALVDWQEQQITAFKRQILDALIYNDNPVRACGEIRRLVDGKSPANQGEPS